MNLFKPYTPNLEYKPLNIFPIEKCLIIAPHPDDESLGCGGFLIKHAKQCDVIILTDGRYGDEELSVEENIRIRKAELQLAMNFIGVNSYKQLDIRDKEMRFNLDILKTLN